MNMPADPQDNGFTLGEPTRELPDAPGRKGKYRSIWERASQLNVGEWLPVTFPTKDGATRFQIGNGTSAKAQGFTIRIIDGVAYVGKRVTPQ